MLPNKRKNAGKITHRHRYTVTQVYTVIDIHYNNNNPQQTKILNLLFQRGKKN